MIFPVLKASTASRIIGATLLCSLPGLEARSDIVRRDWTPVPGATLYEYEVSENLKVTPSSLVRQGSGSDAHFQTDLRPGIYFFRYRALDAKGAPGKWSPLARVVVRGQSTFSFVTPQNGDIVDLPEDRNASLYFEWATVPGAQEYELSLNPTGESRGETKKQNTIATSLSVSGLAPGNWSARVEAKSGGQIYSQSKDIVFQVMSRAQPRPQLLNPREGDQFPAFEMIRVRWIRKAAGNRSLVSTYRIGEKRQLISSEPLTNTTASWIPALEPGKYQITVRDYLRDSAKFVEESSSFSVEIDPLGSQSRRLNIRTQILLVGVAFGSSTADSQFLSSPISGKIPVIRYGDLRFQYTFGKKWGLNGEFASQQRKFQYDGNTPEVFNGGPHFRQAMLGAHWLQTAFGPNKPLYYKISAAYFDAQSPSDSPVAQGRNLHYGAAYLIPEVEFDYTGWNSRYSMSGRAQLRVPFFAIQGAWLGRGTVSFMPGLFGEFMLKRRFAENTWGLLAGTLNWEKFSVNEGEQKASSTRDLLVGFNLGLEFLL